MAEEWRSDIKELTREVYHWFAEDCPGIALEQFDIYEFGNEFYPVIDTESWTGVSTVVERSTRLKYSAMINITAKMREHCTEHGLRCWLIKDMTEGISRARRQRLRRRYGIQHTQGGGAVKASECPDEFRETLKEFGVMELIAMINKLKQFPEDVNYLKAAHDELKQRDQHN